MDQRDSDVVDPTFEADIRVLSRHEDRDAMKDTFDLWSIDDVRHRSQEILDRLVDGSMPCDAAWSPEKVEIFRRWCEAGFPA